jgi:hypothetical protein
MDLELVMQDIFLDHVLEKRTGPKGLVMPSIFQV